MQDMHGVAYLAAVTSGAQVLAVRCVATVNGWLSRRKQHALAKQRTGGGGRGRVRWKADLNEHRPYSPANAHVTIEDAQVCGEQLYCNLLYNAT